MLLVRRLGDLSGSTINTSFLIIFSRWITNGVFFLSDAMSYLSADFGLKVITEGSQEVEVDYLLAIWTCCINLLL